jgi:hypothetical protein
VYFFLETLALLRLHLFASQEDKSQRKTLESLTTQVANYRKKTSDTQTQIKDLENKNAQLVARLQRMTKLANKQTTGSIGKAEQQQKSLSKKLDQVLVDGGDGNYLTGNSNSTHDAPPSAPGPVSQSKSPGSGAAPPHPPQLHVKSAAAPSLKADIAKAIRWVDDAVSLKLAS